jgi:hypothetical protein
VQEKYHTELAGYPGGMMRRSGVKKPEDDVGLASALPDES